MFADKINELAQNLSKEDTREHLLPFFAGYLADNESEVRTAALRNLPEFIKHLDSDQILKQVVPSFDKLKND